MLLNYYVVRIYVVASSCLELRSFLACKRLSTLKSFGLLPMTVDLYECKHQLIFCMLLNFYSHYLIKKELFDTANHILATTRKITEPLSHNVPSSPAAPCMGGRAML